jgi:hypothetical protein
MSAAEDFTAKDPPVLPDPPPAVVTKPYDPEPAREAARGDLARGLLWLLTFTIAGVLVFVGLGRLDGAVITQSIFPSLIALAGTALGFYFGSQSAAKNSDSSSALPQPISKTQAPPPIAENP